METAPKKIQNSTDMQKLSVDSMSPAYLSPYNAKIMSGMPPPRRERKSFKLNKNTMSARKTDAGVAEQLPLVPNRELTPKQKLNDIVQKALEKLQSPLTDTSLTKLTQKLAQGKEQEVYLQEISFEGNETLQKMNDLKGRLRRKQQEEHEIWNSINALNHVDDWPESMSSGRKPAPKQNRGSTKKVTAPKTNAAVKSKQSRTRKPTTASAAGRTGAHMETLFLRSSGDDKLPQSESDSSSLYLDMPTFKSKEALVRSQPSKYKKTISLKTPSTSKLKLYNPEEIQKTLRRQDISKYTNYCNSRTSDKALDEYVRIMYTECVARKYIGLEKL